MAKPILCLLLFSITIKGLFAANTSKDSLTRQQFIHGQTIKADTLNQKALILAVQGAKYKDLNEAIELIMKGLHIYSRYRDSVGLLQTFNHLALTYHLQKKYIQAKWFYIQANSLARDMRDTVNIIHTLIDLSAVKNDIRDYDLAKRDLNEALELAKYNPKIDLQIEVQQGLATFYTKKGDAKRSLAAINRVVFLKDSVTKAVENKKLALLKQEYDKNRLKEQQIMQQKQNTLRIEGVKLQTIVKQKNATEVIALSVTTAIVLAIGVFYLRRKRRRRKKRRQT